MNRTLVSEFSTGLPLGNQLTRSRLPSPRVTNERVVAESVPVYSVQKSCRNSDVLVTFGGVVQQSQLALNTPGNERVFLLAVCQGATGSVRVRFGQNVSGGTGLVLNIGDTLTLDTSVFQDDMYAWLETAGDASLYITQGVLGS